MLFPQLFRVLPNFHECLSNLLYNKPSYSRILIGSRLWSIRGQIHHWRHRDKVFASAFSERILSTPAIFKATSKLFGSQSCSDDKTDLIFPVFSLRFVDFAVEFCLRCKISFHEKPFESSMTVARFLWTNHNSLLRIATNEIASFCIDNRLRQMAWLSSNWERFWNKKAVVVCFVTV